MPDSAPSWRLLLLAAGWAAASLEGTVAMLRYRCTVCGDWYPSSGAGIDDICLPCLTLNFSGAQPPLALDPGSSPGLPWDSIQGQALPAPLAREMLEAYIDSTQQHQVTPRQAAALTRMAEVWRRQAQED